MSHSYDSVTGNNLGMSVRLDGVRLGWSIYEP